MKFIGFILTKTKLLRLLAFIVAGWLVSAGVIGEGNKSQVGESVLLVLTGVVSLLIEHKKDSDAKKAQEVIGAKPDGWFGPVSRASIPGGEFNPNAPVRAAEPVRPHTGGGNRSQRGHVIAWMLFAMAAVCLFMACAAPARKKAEALPDVTATPDIGSRDLRTWAEQARAAKIEYLETRTAEYNRPAFERLLLSVRPWTEVGGSHAKVRLDPDAATLSGGWRDNDRFSYSKLMPDSYAVGFTAGVQTP